MKKKNFEFCINKRELFELDIDFDLMNKLLILAKHRIEFFKEIKVSKKYPSLYLEGHYEIIKELATAILARDGWKALNHECLFAYLRTRRLDLELDFDYLLQLKNIRNAIDYRGASVSYNTWKENKLKISIIIRTMVKYLENN